MGWLFKFLIAYEKNRCKLFLTLLTHQHHHVEFYLAMTNMASEIFQKITCMLGVMYNVIVVYISNYWCWLWWYPLWFIKVSLIKFIQKFIVVVGGSTSYIPWEVIKTPIIFFAKILFSAYLHQITYFLLGLEENEYAGIKYPIVLKHPE